MELHASLIVLAKFVPNIEIVPHLKKITKLIFVGYICIRWISKLLMDVAGMRYYYVKFELKYSNVLMPITRKMFSNISPTTLQPMTLDSFHHEHS